MTRTAAAAALLVGAAFVCDAHGGAESAVSGTSASAVTWEQVRSWIWSDAALYGVSGAWLEHVAFCESRGDPYAVGAQGEVGVWQFHPLGVWAQIPIFGSWWDVYDVRLNVRAGVWAFAHGLGGHWSCNR